MPPVDRTILIYSIRCGCRASRPSGRRRRQRGAGGRNIDTVAAVAAGTNDVGKEGSPGAERRGVFQQRGGGASDFLRMLTAHLHAHQRGGQLLGLTSPRTTAENS